MKRIPNIQITDAMLRKYFNRHFLKIDGGESRVFFSFSLKRKGVVRKIFSRGGSYASKTKEEFSQICENKYEKIQRISQKNLPLNEVEILSTISDQNGCFIGYDMVWDPFTKSLFDRNNEEKQFKNREKIFYFDQIPALLEECHEQGIVYGDLRTRNILINKKTGKVSLCDWDNTQVDDCIVDLIEHHLHPFQKKDYTFPKSVDAYMYNLLLIEELTGFSSEDELLLKLKEKDTSFFQEEAIPLLEKMKFGRNKGEYDGTYMQPYIKRK